MSFLHKFNVIRNINEYARPTETLILGTLFGILLGMTAVLFLPVDVKEEHHDSGIRLCGDIDNIKLIQISIMSKIKYVECLDGRKFSNF